MSQATFPNVWYLLSVAHLYSWFLFHCQKQVKQAFSEFELSNPYFITNVLDCDNRQNACNPQLIRTNGQTPNGNTCKDHRGDSNTELNSTVNWIRAPDVTHEATHLKGTWQHTNTKYLLTLVHLWHFGMFVSIKLSRCPLGTALWWF